MRTVATQTTELDVDDLRCTWAGVELRVSTQQQDALRLEVYVNGENVCTCALDTYGVLVHVEQEYGLVTDSPLIESALRLAERESPDAGLDMKATLAVAQACDELEGMHFYHEDLPSLELLEAAKDLLAKVVQYTDSRMPGAVRDETLC